MAAARFFLKPELIIAGNGKVCIYSYYLFLPRDARSATVQSAVLLS